MDARSSIKHALDIDNERTPSTHELIGTRVRTADLPYLAMTGVTQGEEDTTLGPGGNQDQRPGHSRGWPGPGLVAAERPEPSSPSGGVATAGRRVKERSTARGRLSAWRGRPL